MFATNHVLSGALIGLRTRRNSAAFVLGVSSHLVLDSIPHWGPGGDFDLLLRYAKRDGWFSLLSALICLSVSPPNQRQSVAFAMSGALLPDLGQPIQYFFGFNPFPGSIRRIHEGVQRESPLRLRRELVFGAALGTLVVIGSRRRVRP